MLLLTLVAPSLAQDLGGLIRPELALDVAADREGEDGTEVHTFARAWARGDDRRGDRWFLEVRAQHHLASGDDVEGWWAASVGETGWDGKITGSTRLRAGNLVERWGKLDLLPLVDLLNPRDARSGLMTPAEYQRIPVPMLVLSFGTDRLRAETVVLPFAVADPVFLRGTDWSYMRNGMVEGQVELMQEWEGETSLLLGGILEGVGGSIATLDPSFRRGLDGAVNTKNLPQDTLLNGDVAQRIEFEALGVDGAFMLGYLRSRQAEAQLDPFLQQLLIEERLPDFLEQDALQDGVAGGPLKVAWPRTGMIGGELATLIDAVQVRAEGVFLTNRVLRTPYAGALSRPMAGAGIGLDYVYSSSLQLVLEARWQHLFAPPDAMIFTLPDQFQLAGGIRASGFSERLSVQLGGSYDLSFREYLVLPKVGWRFSDAWLAEVGAVILGGSTPPPATLADAFVYEGGPASYWSQNDAVTLSVTWIR